MKLEAKQVYFLPVGWWITRRELRFVGKMNTIQLLETALVIEGQRKTISYPIIDFLFQQALSEWTTVTVPYSRIIKCRYSRRLVTRSIFLLVVALMATLMIFGSIQASFSLFETLLMTIPFLVALVCLSFYTWFRILPARYNLLYRRADGKRALTRFRVKTRVLRQAFDERLNANRQAASASLGGRR